MSFELFWNHFESMLLRQCSAQQPKLSAVICFMFLVAGILSSHCHNILYVSPNLGNYSAFVNTPLLSLLILPEPYYPFPWFSFVYSLELIILFLSPSNWLQLLRPCHLGAALSVMLQGLSIFPPALSPVVSAAVTSAALWSVRMRAFLRWNRGTVGWHECKDKRSMG